MKWNLLHPILNEMKFTSPNIKWNEIYFNLQANNDVINQWHKET